MTHVKRVSAEDPHSAPITPADDVPPATLDNVQELRVQLMRRGSYGDADDEQFAALERWVLTGRLRLVGEVIRRGIPTAVELADMAERLYGFRPTFSIMEMWTDPLPPLTRIPVSYQPFDPYLDAYQLQRQEEND
jgi:hypothetical protein